MRSRTHNLGGPGLALLGGSVGRDVRPLPHGRRRHDGELVPRNGFGRDGGFVPQSRRGGGGGFTLIEILVTMGLIALMLLLVFYPVWTGLSFMEKGAARADALSAARLAMDAMVRELGEAMYVYDPPPGGRFIAFLAPRSSLAAAAPIAPERVAVRYWRALRAPNSPYAPFYDQATPVNPYYLSRTEISEPGRRDDPWNDTAGALPRATFWYPSDFSYNGIWPTAQPGYPWLEAARLYADSASRSRWYRERAVGLTPSDTDYDVPVAVFSPEAVSEESLLAPAVVFPRDYSRYRARYPLWTNFARCDPAQPAGSRFAATGRVKIYGGDPRQVQYRTEVAADTGHVWVVRQAGGIRIYDTAGYPVRDTADSNQAEFAFGIDYDRGELRFDFPADDIAIVANAEMYIYDLPTVNSTSDLDPDPTLDSRQIVPGSTVVRAEDQTTHRVTYYEQVEPMPASPADIGSTRYAVDGRQIVFDADNGQHPGASEIVHVRYRYRNNAEDQLVVASYLTKAIININLTVSKRDIAARSPRSSRQDATLVAKVKLRNVPR